jgi:uncharacterized protein (DUF2147 family)
MRLLFITAFLALGTGAAAAGPVGVWRVADGSAQVHVMPCRGALCGSVDGKRVLIDMRPNGANLWAGTIVDVRDGTQYVGKISMQGESLRVEGCVLGGAICGGQTWTRVR